MGPTFVSYFVISQGVGAQHRCCLPPQDRPVSSERVRLPKQNDMFHTQLYGSTEVRPGPHPPPDIRVLGGPGILG